MKLQEYWGEGEFATVYSCVRKSGEGTGAKVACKAIKKIQGRAGARWFYLKAKRKYRARELGGRGHE